MKYEQTIVDRKYSSGIALTDFLKANNEVTFLVEAEANFRKTILISAASYFEKLVCSIIAEFAALHSNGNERLTSLVSKKAINRQYHTYFSWDGSNVNSFLGLFGNDFKTEISTIIKGDVNLSESAKAFLELGNERNKLVHENFAEFNIDKTAEEIYNLYKKSIPFIEIIETRLLN